MIHRCGYFCGDMAAYIGVCMLQCSAVDYVNLRTQSLNMSLRLTMKKALSVAHSVTGVFHVT